MSGALVDLVAIGVQDTYLTGEPQTTYFRQAYKRHTNFAMEPVRQVIEGDASQGAWSQVNITRSGDLLSDVYFLADSDGDTAIAAPFEEIQLYIGGQKIDTITREENVACAQQFRLNNSSTNLTPTTQNGTNGSHSLQFFFGRGYGCSLPLCALQYHDVTLRIKWSAVVTGFSLYADYVQLDTEERNAFAQRPLTMLIEQHQRTPMTIPASIGKTYSSLEFSHPVKVVYGTTADASGNAILPLTSKMKLEFNGKERTPSLPTENYYIDHQIGKHTEHGATALFPMYSFALFANRNNPTGSCNFSRLDNARLTVDLLSVPASTQGDLYAINWNMLKLENGMGGLLFAN
jgi:hypothetical protein